MINSEYKVSNVGVIGLIGRPSTGKSSLINKICGQRISIVSTTPQTTRTRIRGIFSSNKGQLVFIDTPGINEKKTKLNQNLRQLALFSPTEIDVLLVVFDITRKFGTEDQIVFDIFKKYNGPKIIVKNKIDLFNSRTYDKTLDEYLQHFVDIKTFHVSTVTGMGIMKLRSHLIALSPVGPFLYPNDMYTDQTPNFRISEIIREQTINLTQDELPYSFYVEITNLSITKNRLIAHGTIWVERSSQIGIIIGKAASKIKKIRIQSETILSDIFGLSTSLVIKVKTKKNWKKNLAFISSVKNQG